MSLAGAVRPTKRGSSRGGAESAGAGDGKDREVEGGERGWRERRRGRMRRAGTGGVTLARSLFVPLRKSAAKKGNG